MHVTWANSLFLLVVVAMWWTSGVEGSSLEVVRLQLPRPGTSADTASLFGIRVVGGFAASG